MLVKRESEMLRTSVYRKETSTDRVLNFDSHHAWNAKAAVVHSLMNRLETHFAPDEIQLARMKNRNTSWTSSMLMVIQVISLTVWSGSE